MNKTNVLKFFLLTLNIVNLLKMNKIKILFYNKILLIQIRRTIQATFKSDI